MATSTGYTVPFPLTAFDSGSPVATWIARDGVIETVNHLCDEQAQPRVSWMAADSSLLSGGQNQYLWPATPAATGVYTRVAIFGPFPISIRENGQDSYKLRILIAGASSAGDSVEFGITVADSMATSVADRVAGTEYRMKKWDAVTSTSPAWLTPTDGSHVWGVSPAIVGAGIRYYTSTNDVAPYDTTAVIQLSQIFVDVWAKTADTSSRGHLYGLHVAEVIGT